MEDPKRSHLRGVQQQTLQRLKYGKLCVTPRASSVPPRPARDGCRGPAEPPWWRSAGSPSRWTGSGDSETLPPVEMHQRHFVSLSRVFFPLKRPPHHRVWSWLEALPSRIDSHPCILGTSHFHVRCPSRADFLMVNPHHAWRLVGTL